MECKSCIICKEGGDEDKLLACDSCDRGYHMYCLPTPLEAAPEGAWNCGPCEAESAVQTVHGAA